MKKYYFTTIRFVLENIKTIYTNAVTDKHPIEALIEMKEKEVKGNILFYDEITKEQYDRYLEVFGGESE